MCRKSLFPAFLVLALGLVSYTRADPSLVAHYEFEDVGGFNDSVSGAAGDPQGDAQVIWDDERGSYVLSLDGDGDYVDYEGAWHGLVETAITVAAWIKTDSLASYDTIVALGYAWRLYGGQDGNVVFQVMDTAPESTVAGTKNVNDGTWHHVAGSFDGTQYDLYVDGRMEASVATSGVIKAGTAYYGCIGAHYKKGDTRDPRRFFDGLIDDVRIYDRVLSEAEIWQVFSFEPGKASNPTPADGQTDVARDVVLSWSPGENAAQHDVYFGADFADVNDADTSDTTGIYRGPQDANSYAATEALAWGATYYWRIDEVNNIRPDSPWVGSVWSFTAADFILVDDFEAYDANDNQIWYAWKDGLGYGTQDTPPYYPGNGTGSAVGDENTPSYTEETIVRSGSQSMPFSYDNNKQGFLKYSEAELTLTYPRDWTQEGVKVLTLWFRGYPASVGSFIEGPVGNYTMTASGADIWNDSDQFHYAWKILSGTGSIVAKVESVENTHEWSKAGVMIRNTLTPDSEHAMVAVTPGNGVWLGWRNAAAKDSYSQRLTGITAPCWVKLQRDISGDFTAYYSTDGSTWRVLGIPQNIRMNTDVYVGLALTSHDAALACEAKFSNIRITGNVVGQWANQDIGIISNEPERMYVAVANADGPTAVVYHENPNAALIDTWTQWNIPLTEFSSQGVVLTDVDTISIGFGDGNNPQPGGSGKMYFDDIRLYRPPPEPEEPT